MIAPKTAASDSKSWGSGLSRDTAVFFAVNPASGIFLSFLSLIIRLVQIVRVAFRISERICKDKVARSAEKGNRILRKIPRKYGVEPGLLIYSERRR